ncbi:hypothetical protein R3J21_07120 [Citrobacter werkmanii]|uniref:hypothetical protein n=1 Tax=Citrobacter werkmanii TaxID=67827 RepID=UPI002955D221|nr:hypothetical protein [Citrobacter werkmanii]MDV7071312.1 hypothetical protein [Citrobacter werkmanii]
MGSNIIELAKLGHERAAELKASCGAVDVRSLAQLISDLATQLEVQFVRSTNMAVQLANAESKCRELAAENEKRNTHSEALAVDNAALREVVERMVNQFAMSGISPEEKSINPAKSLMFDAKSALFMPATDAYLAEVLASSIPDEATERDLFEEWVMEKIFISKTTLEGLRTDDGYRNSTLSGTDYNGMWSQWKAIRAAQLRQEASQ